MSIFYLERLGAGRYLLFLPPTPKCWYIFLHYFWKTPLTWKFKMQSDSQLVFLLVFISLFKTFPILDSLDFYVFWLGMFNPWHPYSKAIPINILVFISLYFYTHCFFNLQLFVCTLMCARVQVCPVYMHTMSSSANFHPSIWERFSYWIWHLSFPIDWLARKPSGSACFCLPAGVLQPALGLLTQAGRPIQLFIWVLDIQTKVLTLVQQTFDWKSHLLSYLICNFTH